MTKDISIYFNKKEKRIITKNTKKRKKKCAKKKNDNKNIFVDVKTKIKTILKVDKQKKTHKGRWESLIMRYLLLLYNFNRNYIKSKLI